MMTQSEPQTPDIPSGKTYRLPKRTKEPAANCPFCGGRDTGDLCGDVDSKAKFYWLQCTKCEACGPTSYDADEALALWNTRRDEADE